MANGSTMSRSTHHFEQFQPHSKHKHLILEQYFLAWAHKLGLRQGAQDQILYVDACAGRGEDDLGNQGSPLIAADAAAIAAESVSKRRGRAFTIRVVAFEPNQKHFSALSRLMQPYGASVEVLQRGILDGIGEIERRFPSTATLYFVDPFGLEPLQSDVIKRALSGHQHEALLLFADQAALRHFGAITAAETRTEKRLRYAVQPLPLLPDLEPSDTAALVDAAKVSRQALELSRENALRIMNAAFGDDTWLATIERAAPQIRRRALVDLYRTRLHAWGATHTLPVPIVDKGGVHAYTLIHASKSPKAYLTMKDAVAYALDHGPLPPTTTELMRQLVFPDPDVVESLVRRQFAGSIVRWADDPTNKQAPSVRAFALENTDAFRFHLDDLKERLRPFKQSGRSITYSFPAER